MVIQCLTVTEDGWPYVAMVSVGELVARSSSSLRLGIWATSTSARNLARDGRCTLALVHAAVSYAIRCRATAAGRLDLADGPALTVFDLTVADVLEDVAPYATLTSGITYTLHDPSAVMGRWRAVVRRLRDGEAHSS